MHIHMFKQNVDAYIWYLCDALMVGRRVLCGMYFGDWWFLFLLLDAIFIATRLFMPNWYLSIMNFVYLFIAWCEGGEWYVVYCLCCQFMCVCSCMHVCAWLCVCVCVVVMLRGFCDVPRSYLRHDSFTYATWLIWRALLRIPWVMSHLWARRRMTCG